MTSERSLAREARRLLHEEGISNDGAMLNSVIRLVPRKRPRFPTAGQWSYVTDLVEAAYQLGLRVGGMRPGDGQRR